MAKAERKSNPFGWIIVGVLVGAIATMGVLMIASSMKSEGGYEEGPTELRTTADDAAASTAARPTPVVAAPKAEAPLPVTPLQPPAATIEPPPVDAQMADDAAAAGMTSRAEQPTN